MRVLAGRTRFAVDMGSRKLLSVKLVRPAMSVSRKLASAPGTVSLINSRDTTTMPTHFVGCNVTPSLKANLLTGFGAPCATHTYPASPV
jgi:hypothetical protein